MDDYRIGSLNRKQGEKTIQMREIMQLNDTTKYRGGIAIINCYSIKHVNVID